MRKFVATAESQGNIWNKTVVIHAYDIVEAQDKFFAWLKKQEVYTQKLSLEIEEVIEPDYEVIQ